jgi:hypothetical protein
VGHEAIISGRIEGASWRVGEQFIRTHDLNREALATLPEDDDWPWVVRGIFALPAPYPQGTYRSQVIHFGLSIKDEPTDRSIWNVWLVKFEAVLRRLYWWSATVLLETEFEPPRLFEWLPTQRAMDRLLADPPEPITGWVRTVRVLQPAALEPPKGSASQ